MNAAMLEYLYIWLAFVVRSPYEQGVTMANSNQCAYLLCSYYLSCKTSDDFQEFTTACARNELPVTTWPKKRKKIYKICVINTPTKMAVKMAKTSHLKPGSVLITLK